MAATTNRPGASGGPESDSQKLDSIATYVRNQQQADRSWTATLGRFTTYLALAAFFFGIGTFTDLRNRIVAPPPAAGQVLKDGFVTTLDQYCKGLIDVRPSGATGTGWARIAADDQAVLTGRTRMELAWTTYSPTNLSARDAGAFASIKSYYFAASDLLQAAIGRAQASDLEGYARDIGLYRQANAAFLKEASDFGFTVCNYYWGVDDVPGRPKW